MVSRLTVDMRRDFVPERTWIAATFCGEFLRVDHDIAWREALGPTRLLLADGAFVSWPDVLFRGDESLWPGAATQPQLPLPRLPLPAAAAVAVAAGDMPQLYPATAHAVDWSAATVALPFDVFGAAFALLSRLEETRPFAADTHGRFPAAASLLGRSGLLERPLVDEMAELVAWLCAARAPGFSRRARAFRLLPSHDVDEPFQFAATGPAAALRRATADVVKRRAPRMAWRNLRQTYAVRRAGAADPYDTFAWLMDRSDEHGLQSAFFFMGSTPSRNDPAPAPTHPLVRSLAAQVRARGHEVGFHPGYQTCDAAAFWRAELERLRAALGDPIDCGRQHFLRFRMPQTWRLWEAAGMRYDSTMGFADHVGFRTGAAREYTPFDVFERRPLQLRERPLIVMEVSLLGRNYMDLGHAAACDRALALRRTCQRLQGDFTLLWHNSRLTTDLDREVYTALLKG